MAEDRIVVTATGIISALGNGRAAHLHALRSGQSGLHHPRFLKTVHAGDYVLGEVDRSNEDLCAALSRPAGSGAYTRTTLLALSAMDELLQQVDADLLKAHPLAFINANTVGGMCEVENFYSRYVITGEKGDHNKYIDTIDCAESTENVARHFGLDPFLATISTACSSSANAILLGARMIRQGLVERAICGGCDALSRFTLNGFTSLKNVDRLPCRPFDQHRNGLNLGEGAGYLLLEKERDAAARGATVIAVLAGYSNTNDAYHPTAPSPDGAGAHRAMTLALQHAALSPQEIGYINAHGTATVNNDAAEGKAIQNLWDGNAPAFSSTKPFTGHTLAAAGAVEAIFSLYSLQEGFIPANLNFETPMEELDIRPLAQTVQHASLKHVLSNSFGFGGNNVSLIFSQP
jgi:3-oxoacyl-[acyl-carrier-protein] synthase-1